MLATRGVSAAEPYLTRYLPALVLAAVLPPLAVVVIATQDLLSAVIVLCHAAAGAGVRCPGRPGHPGPGPGAVARDVVAVRPLPRRGARAAHAGRAPPGARAVRAHRGDHRPLPRRLAADAADRVRLVAGPRARRHAVGRPGRGHRRRPAGRWARSGCTPRSSSCSSPPRRTGRCAGSGPSSTPPPRAWPPSRPSATLLAGARERHGRRGRDGAAPAGAPLVLTTSRSPTPAVATPPWPRLDAVIPAVGLTVVTGPSGCGKSTLLDALAGLLPLSAGSITADGRPIGGADVAAAGRLAAAAAALRRRLDRRQPAARPTGRVRREALGRPCARSRWRSGSAPCPTGSTAPSARTAPRSPPASGPGSRWPASSSPTVPGCCSTSRRRTSTS